MQYCPFFDEADSRAGTNPASEQFPIKGERRQLAPVLSMEVANAVLAIEHADDDAEER